MPIAPTIVSVIDDDESMCRALSRMLRVVGYQVRTYFSAEAFLSDQEHPQTKFVVVDVQLRGMSGFDLQRRLHLELPDLPVAFITAHDEQETRAQAAAAGCAGYLRKPFPGSQLISVIQRNLAPSTPAPASPVAERPSKP